MHYSRDKADALNDILFKETCAASHKYDGTNVGKDEFGVMYGRNLTIPSDTKSYQKTPLDFVQKLDAKAVKAELLKQTGITEDSIACFNIYGELMCNSGLYNYTADKLDGTHQIFGALIKVANKDVVQEIADKLGAAKFACKVKGSLTEDDEDGALEEAKEGEECQIKIAIYMNHAFKELIMKQGFPVVSMAGTYASFYELAMENFEWMKDGKGEGLVVVSPADGPRCDISKWKIGAETSGDNLGIIKSFIIAIENDADNKIFGANTEKAKELFVKMLEVEKSKLINGEIPKPQSKGPRIKEAKQPKQVKQAIMLSDEEQKEYEDAIKSAKSKFDHEDTFFAKNMKGVEEYSVLIGNECLNDIKIDKGDKEAMDKHNTYIKQMIKEDFIAYMRNKKK